MEKRLLLAAGLSLVILYVWSALNPPPKTAPRTSKETQPVVAEDVAKMSDASPSPALPVHIVESKGAPAATAPVVEKKITVLENDLLRVEFSNIGGNIQNIFLKKYDTSLPLKNVSAIQSHQDKPFKLTYLEDDTLRYVHTQGELTVEKTYRFATTKYGIESNIRLINNSKMSKMVDIGVTGYTMDMSNLEEVSGQLSRDRALFEYVINAEKGFHRKNNAHKFKDKEEDITPGSVNWVGFRNRYFCLIFNPFFSTENYQIDVEGEDRASILVGAQDIQLAPGESTSMKGLIYAGPEEIELLRKYEYDFDAIQNYYNFGLFDFIAKMINRFMHFVHNFIPNWGVCIILVSTLIYFSMYPMTMRSMTSMKKMQALQPKMKSLRDKYQDNPQKLNKEMMELYKEHGVNPLGGCLPMLLQLPIFIGLYQVLWRDVSFKGAEFLWIKDLSEPDKLFILPFKLPVIGNEVNLLPILMMCIMFVQMRFSSRNMAGGDAAQVAQQKLMGSIMPIVLGWIFYHFASGLTLYFTMFYIFSTLTQWKVSKQPKGA